MLQIRPSPAVSSTDDDDGGGGPVVVGDPRALSEWLDRILWLSDRSNWGPEDQQEQQQHPQEEKEEEGTAETVTEPVNDDEED
jgi:hypothetical protein